MIPTQCQLWQKEQITHEDIKIGSHLEIRNTFEDNGHLLRRLLRCKECGQLYFHEDYEWTNWQTGNDLEYRTFIPVESEEDASKLAEMTPLELLSFFPRLQNDWPADKILWIK